MSDLTILIGVIVLILGYVIAIYNYLVRLRNHIADAWSNIDTELKRRYELAVPISSSMHTVHTVAGRHAALFQV